MKKLTKKRLLLGALQQLMAMGALIAIAGILFNSFLTFESLNGSKTYKIDPFNTEKVFEDSDIYQEIFRSAVSDIARLVVIKGQLEIDGEFAPEKQINVTQYAQRKGPGNDCNVTAVYALKDLIQWGRSGIEYNNRIMSMSDFLNYFGPAIAPENFALDEKGQLYFAGFQTVWSDENSTLPQVKVVRPEEELLAVQDAFLGYTTEQLEDMVFSYIVSEYPEEIAVSREDDGSLNVYCPMIICRQETVDGERQLISYADNWVDYLKLQMNLSDTIESISSAYTLYQDYNEIYKEGNTNLNYMVRMMTDEGQRTFCNVSEYEKEPDNIVTEHFSEFRRYLIYYPDSLEFTGNTVLSEDEIHKYIREYEYAYPETTHIWIGVENSYPIAGDAFYNANTAFQKIVPYAGMIASVIALFALVWVGCFLYLSVTAGVFTDKDGSPVKYVNGFDRVWTEVLAGLFVLLWYFGRRGYGMLLEIADAVYAGNPDGGYMARLHDYAKFGVYGILLSICFCALWYSLMRRLRSATLWKDSFVRLLITLCGKFAHFIFRHKNSAVSTLLPYNLFLGVNLVGIFFVVSLWESRILSMLTIFVVVVFDVIVGMLLFKHNAEQIEIMDGMNRIRDGEVDFKLDTANLHGVNREMAEAVNTIGEGIRNAVKTSMKDERMKTDLITNVSHDIKTPLTSIINYVDLLKRLKIEEEPAKSYISVLESKSQRLKQLTDDLVEASKISSGNIVLNLERLNLTELLNQAAGEFSEKLEERGLEVVFSGSELKADIYADSRRMWRVVENLFNNIYKYAMENTRVYLDLTVQNGRVEASVKNISQSRMNIRPEELTERFIRGDISRSAEGSGLGLSIAQSLTQLQGGEFQIYLDGDLFKVVISFPEYEEKTGVQ